MGFSGYLKNPFLLSFLKFFYKNFIISYLFTKFGKDIFTITKTILWQTQRK